MDLVRMVSSSNGRRRSSGDGGPSTIDEEARSGSVAAVPAPVEDEATATTTVEMIVPGAETAAAATVAEDDRPAEIPVEGAEDDGGSEEDDDYEYEDEDDSPYMAGFLVDNPAIAATRSSEEDSKQPTKIEDEEAATAASAKPKWREPSRQAVNMSLRAEQETSGSKRRLAQDLYRIMNQDTQEAGFSLQPAEEDSMNKWAIKLFQFDEDSNLAKDMKVLGLDAIELEMTFPDQYPFEPPFVRVHRPRFKKQTGFVMNGALCMELLTKEGWNPINDIESVIVSVRSLLVVGDGRLEAAVNLSETKYNALLAAAEDASPSGDSEAKGEGNSEAAADSDANKRQRKNSAGESVQVAGGGTGAQRNRLQRQGGTYSVAEAKAAYSHLSDYHKKKGWDSSGWWARKG